MLKIVPFILFVFSLMACDRGQEDCIVFPVSMRGIWKEVGDTDLRKGSTFVFSKNGTVIYFLDPEVCVKKDKARIGEYAFSQGIFHMYFYKILVLEAGNLEKIQAKCDKNDPNIKFEEKLIELLEGSMKLVAYGDFKQIRSRSGFEDFTSFKVEDAEFYQFSKFPEHFREIIDYEIRERKRLILQDGNLKIRNNTKKSIKFSLD